MAAATEPVLCGALPHTIYDAQHHLRRTTSRGGGTPSKLLRPARGRVGRACAITCGPAFPVDYPAEKAMMTFSERGTDGNDTESYREVRPPYRPQWRPYSR